ncbi:MAG: hypothetical protein V3T83_05140 [Acidobacteriota bacterium]
MGHALAAAGLQRTEAAGIRVSYSTAPGSVTGYAASVSADQDIAYRVPLTAVVPVVGFEGEPNPDDGANTCTFNGFANAPPYQACP